MDLYFLLDIFKKTLQTCPHIYQRKKLNFFTNLSVDVFMIPASCWKRPTQAIAVNFVYPYFL